MRDRSMFRLYELFTYLEGGAKGSLRHPADWYATYCVTFLEPELHRALLDWMIVSNKHNVDRVAPIDSPPLFVSS